MSNTQVDKIGRWGMREVVFVLIFLVFCALGTQGLVLYRFDQISADRSRENCEVINTVVIIVKNGFQESLDTIVDASRRDLARMTPEERADREKRIRDYDQDYERRVIRPLEQVVRDCREEVK